MHYTWIISPRSHKAPMSYREIISKCIWVLDHILAKQIISVTFKLHLIKIINVMLVYRGTIALRQCLANLLWRTTTKLHLPIIVKWPMIQFHRVPSVWVETFKWVSKWWDRWYKMGSSILKCNLVADPRVNHIKANKLEIWRIKNECKIKICSKIQRPI